MMASTETYSAASLAEAAALVERGIRDAVDLAFGDPLFFPAGSLDPMESVNAAAADGFRAIVINEHCEPVSPVAAFLRDNASFRPAIAVAAGVVLNHEVGGLNVFAAEHCLMLAGRLVSMPTLSSQNYCRKFRRALARASNAQHASLSDRLTLVDERFLLRPEVSEVLELMAAHDAVLDAGYAHLSEVWVLLAEAKRHGISRILVRDPDRYAGALPEEIAALAEAGACIGFTLSDTEDEVDRFANYGRVPRDHLALHLVPQTRRRTRSKLVGQDPEGHDRAAAFVAAITAAGAAPNDIMVMLGETASRLFDGEAHARSA